MKIKLMKRSVYANLRKNYKEICKLVEDNPDDVNWLYNYLGDEYPFTEIDINCKDFDLDYADDASKYELSNAIKLYEALKDLPAIILYCNRFWAWVIFEKAYKQTQQNFKYKSAEKFRDRWFPENSDRRSLLYSAIAREFIKVKYSVVEGAKDPYELTRYLIGNKALYDQYIFRNIADLPQVTHATLKIEKELRENTKTYLNEHSSNLIMKTASFLGSSKLIDIMTEDEVEVALREKFNSEYPGILSH